MFRKIQGFRQDVRTPFYCNQLISNHFSHMLILKLANWELTVPLDLKTFSFLHYI